MHPTIISLGPIAIRSYGLMLAIGFMTGIMFAAWRARKWGENPDHIYNLAVYIVISALLGARIYYIVTHYIEFSEPGLAGFSRFFGEFRNMFWPIGADGQVGINGLVLYGGIISATLTTVAYLKLHGLKIARYLDIMGPSLGLGEFFTRIGCFLNGCCFGKPTESAFGVVFPFDSAAGSYYPGLHIHPAQLYNSLGGLAIFGLLLLLERWRKFDGFTAAMYFLLYAVVRFTTDFTRHYEQKLTYYGLSHNQWLSVAIFICAAAVLVYLSRRSKTTLS